VNTIDKLSRVSSHVMTLTGFFHGVIRSAPFVPAPRPEARPYVVRYHILKQLDRPGAHHPTGLSCALSVKKNTLSELLDRMVRDGLVVREADAADRRRITLRITPAGRSSAKTFEKSVMANMRRFLATLAEEDRRDLVRAMESLVRILERHDRSSGKRRPS